MATVQDILRLAESQLGTCESPAGSNRVKYNRDYYGGEVSGAAFPWCCVFQWWLFHTAGADKLFFGGDKTAHCDTLFHYYRKHGQTVDVNRIRPGDLIFFNFDGNSRTLEHIGICVSTQPGYVTTIDGNTGSGNDANGGAVLRRRRPLSCVGGAARPLYDTEKRPSSPLTIYRRVEDMPTYFQSAAQKAIALGIMGVDSNGLVNTSWSALQSLTWMERLGLLDKKEV